MPPPPNGLPAGDLELVALPGVRGIALPMAEDDAPIREIHARAGAAAKIVPLVETALDSGAPSGLPAPPASRGSLFGSVDFQMDTNITGEREELLYAGRSQLVIASRVAGRGAPVDGVTIALDDEALLKDDVARARALGFAGEAVHPPEAGRGDQRRLPPAAGGSGMGGAHRRGDGRRPRARRSRSTAGWSTGRCC